MKGDCGEKILLVGNPNTGKTTLFNSLTASEEHVGNWHGVTVEEKSKNIKFENKCLTIVDLPGIYSLKSLSYEEEVAIKFIKDNPECKIINICDENNLERNLFLTLCLIEEGHDVVLAVNSTLKKPLCSLNTEILARELGIDVVRVDAKKGLGNDELLRKVRVKKERKVSPRSKDMLSDAEKKYEIIEKILAKSLKKTANIYGKSKIDRFLLNRFFAPLVFFGIMGVIFYLTFFLIGAPLSKFLSSALDCTLGKWSLQIFTACFGGTHWLTLLIRETVIGGIGTILSFLPQIVLLFFFLAVLEESGYLSRVAFVFDDLLAKIGLSGRSIYTLLLGFGCSASAILTARNMDDKRAKIKTTIVTPFLSCSARLPIYLAVGGAFFGSRNIFVILGLYALGIIVMVASSLLLEKTILKSNKQSFLLEFPAYRGVSLFAALKLLWKNTKSFVLRVGSTLLAMNIIVWVFSNFSFAFDYVGSGGENMLGSIAKFISPVFSPLGFSAWGLIVALLVGIVAKEGVVGTMVMLSGGNLVQALFCQNGVIGFASASAVLSFLTFCLLYVPCLSTIAVMKKEIGTKWTLFACGMQILVAYIVAFIVFNLSRAIHIFGLIKIVIIILAILGIILLIAKLFRKKPCDKCNACHKQKMP